MLNYDSTAGRSRSKVNHGADWDEDNCGPAHAVYGGRTLCGVRVGTDAEGWFTYRTSAPIECKRCLLQVRELR